MIGDLGRKGEDIAVRYLMERNYEILCRNFRSGRHEIDIIARKDGVVVFVEVKTRSSGRFGEPEEAVDGRKLRRLKGVAAAWLSRSGGVFCRCRFDIIGILLGNGTCTVRHTEDIFT